MGSRRSSTLGAVLATVLLLAGCGQDAAQDPAGTASPQPVPTAPTEAPSHPSDADEQPADDQPAEHVDSGEVTVWLARQNDAGIWLEPQTVPLDEGTVGVLRAAVEAVVAGQSANPELVTLVPAGTTVQDVRIEGGVAVVDLSGEVRDAGGSSAQELALAQQLAQTATQFDSVDAVRLLIDGQPIDELWGHLDWSEPITADPHVISPIVIESPAWGATLEPGPVTASGTSVTFESTVELRLVAPDGTVVEETHTTAAQPDTGQRGPWTHTFAAEASTAGPWTIEAIEPDPSGGEGPPPFTTSVQFVVS